MSLRRRGDPTVNGVVVVDKPPGISSFDVVRQLKRTLGTSRVGHTGTLDPMATGALVICFGWSTRLVPFLSEGRKRYTGTIRLGVSTSTDDAEGEPISFSEHRPSDEAIAVGMASIEGVIEQVPPAVSAIKVDGRRAYALARDGEEVVLAAREATVEWLGWTRVSTEEIEFDVVVSKGTYIRSLARDLGTDLGCGAHLSSLRRVENAGFGPDEMLPIGEVTRESLLTPWQALGAFPVIELEDTEATRLEQGQRVPVATHHAAGVRVRVARSGQSRLVAVAEITSSESGGMLRAVRVQPPAG